MLFNAYVMEKTQAQEMKERLEEAANERLARSIRAWLKGEENAENETWMQEKPEPQISMN